MICRPGPALQAMKPADGTRHHEENRCDNQPDKRGKSGGTRGNGATRGAGRGRGGVKRGNNTTTNPTRGGRMAKQEAMAWQEAEAYGTWRCEENCRDNQPDKRPEMAVAAKGKGGCGGKSSNGGDGGAGTRGGT